MDFSKLTKVFTASVVSIAVVQVLLGVPIFDLFLNSSCGNVSAPALNLPLYILVLAIVFAIPFYLIVEEVKPTQTPTVGFKIGALYGIIASVPTAALFYLFSRLSLAFIGGSILVAVVDFGVAGALAMFVLSRSRGIE